MMDIHSRVGWLIWHQKLVIILTHPMSICHNGAYWKVIDFIINRNSKLFLYYFLNPDNIADFLRLNFNQSQLLNSYSYIFLV